MPDSVNCWVSHVEVARRHIDFRPQYVLAVGKRSLPHSAKDVEVLFYRSIPIGAVLSGFRQRSPIFPRFLGAQAANVGFALIDELEGKLVELLEIVRCVVETVFPVESQPADVTLDRVLVFRFFPGRIRVIESEIAQPLIFGRNTEVQADRFRMADVQVPVGFRRETGVNLPVNLAS